MKNINQKIKTIFLLVFCSGIMHASDTLSTQKKIRLNSIYMLAKVNGNGFGMQYVPTISIRVGERILLSGGEVFSAGDWEKTGTLFGAGYLLLRENKSYSGHVSLSMNFSLTKIHGADLSPAAVAYEKRLASGMKNEGTPCFESLRYSGWEYASGFSMNYRFSFGLLLKTSISYALTQTHQDNYPLVQTSRENKFGSLQLSAGIGWGFGKMKSRSEHQMDLMADEQEENSSVSLR